LPSVGTLAAAVGGGIVVMFVALVIRNVRQIRRFTRDNNEAVAMLARGELQRAYDVFWRWAERARVPYASALARHNVACTLVRQGKLQHAIDVYTHNEQLFGRALISAALHPTSAADLALAHALAGNVAEAETWLARADERAEQPRQPAFPIIRVYARAVIDCRSGRAADAARELDNRWGELEVVLTGSNVRPIRVVRAFAHAAIGPRNAGVVEQVLTGMRPAYAGEFRYLGVAWPEMHQFLEAHGLAS
jgi:hypothetical protein